MIGLVGAFLFLTGAWPFRSLDPKGSGFPLHIYIDVWIHFITHTPVYMYVNDKIYTYIYISSNNAYTYTHLHTY